MPQAFNAYEKDFLREYHYRFYECFESAQRTADAELCILLSKRRMAYPEILAHKFMFYP